jgi:mRNA interferase MazF
VSDAPQRGEIWRYATADRTYNVVVLSTDLHNSAAGAYPVCVLVYRRQLYDDEAAFMTRLANEDPIGGTVDVTTVRELHPDGFAERVGMVTGATLDRIHAAMRDLFET